MPSLTRKQFDARQAKAPAGWSYDSRFYIFYGENQLKKRVKIDATHYIEAAVGYTAEIARRDGEYCSWHERTGRHIPEMTVSYWTVNPETGTASSFGLGHQVKHPELVQEKKIYTVLCKLAETISDADVLEIAQDHLDVLLDPVIVG